MLDADRYQRAKAIFFEACERDAADRGRFVEAACSGDTVLRDAVTELLRHDEQPLQAISDGIGSGPMRDHLTKLADDAPLPARIGRYRIVSRLGEGGMGVVYLAEQDSPRRQVALKVMASNTASRQTLRRFEHEAHILGRLHHPGIAQVYEAGVHDGGEGGQPFFAMELVRGRSLTRFCEESMASMRERVGLFILVCEAVQHAHQQGVVHRDLKPGNILVEESLEAGEAATPRPKVLDFGVARLTDSDVQATTMHTAADQLIGTVAYMSPEQMAGRAGDIDTRSDVFALGVILFELLANRLPHDVAGKSIPDMIRTISESDPTTLSSINRDFRGDLDTIVGKAMERDKSRRYQSAGELAADVRRFLADEPIHARPPTATYQFRKFARRNKALVGGAACVFVALAAGIMATTWQARQAIAARDREIDLRKEADDNAALAISAAGQANASLGFLHRLLSSADPHASKGRDYTVRQLLDDFAQGDMESLRSQPEVLATVLSTIGLSYLSLGELKAAEPRLREALEIRRQLATKNRAALAEALVNWAAWQHDVGDFGGAEASLQEALALYERMRDRAGDAARTRASLGDMLRHQHRMAEGITVLEGALAEQRALEAESDLPVTLSYLASAYEDDGRYALAEPLLREALELDDRHEGRRSIRSATAMSNLGLVLIHTGKYAESQSLLEESLRLGRAALGEEHPEVAKRWNNLGMVHEERGDKEAAKTCYRTAIEIQRRHPEYDQANLESMLRNLAITLLNNNEADEAETVLRQATEVAAENGRANDSDEAARMGLMGEILARKGEVVEAERLFRESLARFEAMFEATHPLTLLARMRLGDLLLDLERIDEARPLVESVFNGRMKLGVPGQNNSVVAAIGMARLRIAEDRPAEAVAALEQVMPAALEQLGLRSGVVHHALNMEINALAGLERWDEANQRARVKIEGVRLLHGEDSLEVADWLAMLGINLHEQNQWSDAEPILREAHNILKRYDEPAVMVQLARVTWRLGAARATQNDYVEGERLMLEGFAGIHGNALVSIMEQAQAADWLATLYQRWNRPEDAARWKDLHAAILETQPTTQPQ